MGQNQALELSEEEKDQLSIGLLRSWWLEASQALVDVVGSEEALRLMKPYYEHAGMAARRVFQSIANTDLDGLEIGWVGYLAHGSWLGGKEFLPYRASDGSGISERRDCSTSGICKEACISICSILPLSWVKEMNPEWEISLIRSLSWGDNCCQWKIWKSGTKPKVEVLEEMRVDADHAPPNPLDDSTWKNLGLAYAGENWVLSTRAILDSTEREGGIEDLLHRMRLYGLSIGLRARARAPKQSKVGTISDIVNQISSLHQRKGEITSQNEGVAGTVEECPFASSAPPEICLQYEAFFNGICEAIDPDYKFAYDRMMTKGDKTCQWTIRKKWEAAKEKVKEEASPDDPAKILATRFAKGEITEEEFARKMALLREHYAR